MKKLLSYEVSIKEILLGTLASMLVLAAIVTTVNLSSKAPKAIDTFDVIESRYIV
ncbi:MAG: hypothetical protein RR620_08835 [Clostridium sp.]